MKKLAGIIAALVIAAIPSAAETYELFAGPFDKADIRGDFNIVYRNVPDSIGYVAYDSDIDYSPALDVTVKKGKLSIYHKNVDQEPGPAPTIRIYSDYLTSIVNEGNGTFDAVVNMSTPTFSAKQVGNGKIILDGINTTTFKANIETGNGSIIARGRCEEANFTLMGTGVIQADALTANEVKCKVLGTGTIGCRPLDVLDVRGIGTTKVYYYGTPTVKKVGGARLEQMQGSPLPAATDDNNDQSYDEED